MLFFYVRHGEPIYNPDSLTEVGHEQAVALSHRLSRFGIDEIYASPSNRAQKTAQPTADALGKEIKTLDFISEGAAFRSLSVVENEKRLWFFQSRIMKRRFAEPDVVAAGLAWHTLPDLAPYGEAYARIGHGADGFLSSLGFQHIAGSGLYRVTEQNEKRVALFAHQGFGMAFLSHILDIPYPLFCRHFDLPHSGITVIHFGCGADGYSIPKV
ncbi:MAG: histidine phosphatase family protein, partial [Clostridia bacterium]|nr:histidine phosphatase family protein [Clostridia bacterium]